MMSMVPFHEIAPEVAERETRSIIRNMEDGSGLETFHLVEFYCPDPSCDCRRVMIWAVRGDDGTVAATISHAFEPPSEREDPYWRDEGGEDQTFLDPLNPQSEQSEELLDVFRDVVLTPDYQARLERHYQLAKDTDTSYLEDEYADDGEMHSERLRGLDSGWVDHLDASGDGDVDAGPVYLDDSVVEQARKERNRLKRRMSSSDRKKAGRAAKLARYRLEKLVINDYWREDGFAHIVAVRRAPKGTYAQMFALVDLGCLGLKRFRLDTGLSRSEMEGRIHDAFHEDSPAAPCSPALARRILQHAVTWSEQAGLDTSKDVFTVDAFLGGDDWTDIDEPVPLGSDGQHFYLPGPRDDWRATMKVLRKNLGPNGFHYLVPADLQ